MERVFVLLIIIVFVIVLGVSLRSLQLYRPFNDSPLLENEGFTDTVYQRKYDNANMTGYVGPEHGSDTDVFRPENGEHHSQLSNVPTAKEYVIGRIKKYKSHVPLNNSDKEYTIGSMDDEIIQKFSKGTNPDIVLNPDSHIEDQITCDLEQDCDEYVRNSKLYCPMGIDRLKIRENSGKENEMKYQGCYTFTRNYPLLACRYGDRFNYCSYMNDLKIQRVGRGFYVLPTLDVIKDAVDKADTESEKRNIQYIMYIKIYIIRHMILTYDHEDVKKNHKDVQRWFPWSSTGSSLLDQYGKQLFYNTFILYQSKTSKTPSRIGFIMRTDTPLHLPKGHIPELSTPSTRHSYNLKNVGYIHDTTQDPMPILQPLFNRPKMRNTNMTSD
jgi:hypothetical protein